MADSPNTTSLTSRRLFLAAGSAGAALGAMGVAAATAAPGEDAKLTRLAAAFRAAWEYEKAACKTASDAEYEAATDVTGAIVDEMVKTQAKTFSGLRAKAEALHWCHGAKFEGISPKRGDILYMIQKPTTDMRLADAILADLLAIQQA